MGITVAAALVLVVVVIRFQPLKNTVAQKDPQDPKNKHPSVVSHDKSPLPIPSEPVPPKPRVESPPAIVQRPVPFPTPESEEGMCISPNDRQAKQSAPAPGYVHEPHQFFPSG